MSSPLTQVRSTIDEHHLCPAQSRGLVALSGGADSLALTHMLLHIGTEVGFSIKALTIDHGIRSESRAEAEAVVALGKTLGIDVVLQSLDLGAVGQEDAREARLRALEQFAAAHDLNWIALGHTADDQAETVLMRALRGSGPRGLGGIAVYSRPWIRPMLGVFRSQIQQYLEERGLCPVEDPSNAGGKYLRNRLRHDVMPLLRRENPKVQEAFCRLAENCSEESDALQWIAKKTVDECLSDRGLHLSPLEGLPVGLTRRVLATFWCKEIGNTRRLTRDHLQQLSALASRRKGSERLELLGHCLERRYDRLLFVAHESSGEARHGQTVLYGPGVYALPGGRLTVQRCVGTGVLDEVLAKEVHWPLLARGVLPGDRIRIGADARKRVSRLFIERKIPRALRPKTWIIADEQRILLLLGVRRAYGLEATVGQPVYRFHWMNDTRG